MDVFQSTITSLSLLYKFLDSYAEFPGEAKSLSIRLRRDVRILQKMQEHLATNLLISGARSSQNEEDNNLLIEMSSYLEILTSRAIAIESKINARAPFWQRLSKQLLWRHHGPKIVQLQEELHEWVESFDLRMLAIPESVRVAIQDHDPTTPHMLRTQEMIRQILSKLQGMTESKNDDLLLDPEKRLSQLQPTKDFLRATAILDGEHPVLVEYRRYDTALLQDNQKQLWSETVAENERLALILNCSQSTTIGLPQCQGMFNVKPTLHDVNGSFGFVLKLPFSPASSTPLNLAACFDYKNDVAGSGSSRRTLPPKHPLSDRFGLALRLSIILLLIHSSGWLHESITSKNVVLIHTEKTASEKLFPYSLGMPLLLGFHLSRSELGHSVNNEATGREEEEAIYVHPRRLYHNEKRPRFRNSFDMYSFGVILLELGLWRRIFPTLKQIPPMERRQAMVEMLPALSVFVGNSYAEIVKWCLAREDEDLEPRVFMKNVVEKLETCVAAI